MSFKKLCLVLGSGLGLGLATYSLYRLIQSLTEEDKGNNWLRGSGEVFKVPMKEPSLYIRVPVHLIPRLVGSKGENIRELQAKTQTQIYFDNAVQYADQFEENSNSNEDVDSNDWNETQNETQPKRSQLMGYRLMNIRGADEDVKRVEKLVTAMIQEHTIESMVIPDGCNIVGPDGDIINEIQDQSGARVKIEGSKYTCNRSVLIIGNDKQRGCAKRMINKIIDEFCDQNPHPID